MINRYVRPPLLIDWVAAASHHTASGCGFSPLCGATSRLARVHGCAVCAEYQLISELTIVASSVRVSSSFRRVFTIKSKNWLTTIMASFGITSTTRFGRMAIENFYQLTKMSSMRWESLYTLRIFFRLGVLRDWTLNTHRAACATNTLSVDSKESFDPR